MDDEELGRIMSTVTTAIVDARNQAAQIGIDSEFRELVKHAREMHELLLEAMEEAPELVNDELRAYCDDTNAEIRGSSNSEVGPRASRLHNP